MRNKAIILLLCAALLPAAGCSLKKNDPEGSRQDPVSEESIQIIESLPAETEPAVTQTAPAELQPLLDKYPMFGGPEAFKGIEVYMWQTENEGIRCGALYGTNRSKYPEEIYALRWNSVSADEMKSLLEYYTGTCGVSPDNVSIIPCRQMNGDPETDAAFTAQVQEIFSDYPVISFIDPELEELKKKYAPYFRLNAAEGISVYVWQNAENAFHCCALNASDAHYSDWFSRGASVDEMKQILADYSTPEDLAAAGTTKPPEITIIPCIQHLSSYYYEINDAYISKLEELFPEYPVQRPES